MHDCNSINTGCIEESTDIGNAGRIHKKLEQPKMREDSIKQAINLYDAR